MYLFIDNILFWHQQIHLIGFVAEKGLSNESDINKAGNGQNFRRKTERKQVA